MALLNSLDVSLESAKASQNEEKATTEPASQQELTEQDKAAQSTVPSTRVINTQQRRSARASSTAGANKEAQRILASGL